MNLKLAKEIVKHGVIPGDFDSIDLAEAKGFLEAAAHAEILLKALERVPTTWTEAEQILQEYKSKMGLSERREEEK